MGPGTVVLAVYRPERRLLVRQVASLQAQTYRDWTCLIGLDGADADTEQFLKTAVAGDPRFTVRTHTPNVGVYRQFGRLLAEVPAAATWVALADQDDYWEPSKLERLLPLLTPEHVNAVTGQARVVDTDGNVLGHTRRRPGDLASTLFRNQLTGSFSVLRADLVARALPFPVASEPAIHDHWLAVCAAATGTIELYDGVVQDYVQHGANVIGERPFVSLGSVVRDVRRSGLRSQLQEAFKPHWDWRVAMASGLIDRGLLEGDHPLAGPLAHGRLGWAGLRLLLRDVRTRRLRPLSAAGILVSAWAGRGR